MSSENTHTDTFPFGPAKPVYLNFIEKSFQKQIAYKFEYFVGVLNGLLFIFVFTSLWNAIYAGADTLEGSPFTRSQMISYAVFAMLFRISMTMEDNEIGRKIRTGAISMDFIKPVSYPLMLFSEAIGQTLFHWFTRVIPLSIISLLAFDAVMPQAPSAYVLTAIAWVLGYSILYIINFGFSLLAFWFTEVFSFQLMKFGLFTLFSGGIVPIDFFPDFAKPLIALIPFQYILYVPTSIFIGHIQGAEAIRLLLIQAVWVFTLGFICWRVWKAAQKKLIIQGG